MSKFKCTTIIFLIAFAIMLNATDVRLNQKGGLWQSQPLKQITFKSYEKLNIDFEKMPLKIVLKILIHEKKLFILDFKRSQIFVTDKTGKHLYTIGRPGQGPGDIESGWDFCIADGKVYVLSNMSRRISIFTTAGEAVKLIKLEDVGGLSMPNSIAVNRDGSILIGSAIDPVISLYNSDGKFKEILVKKADMAAYKNSPPAIAIPSSLKISSEYIFHCDLFKGIVTKTNAKGQIVSVFSAYRDYIQEDINGTIEELKNETGRSVVTNWSHSFIDESGKIFMMSTIKKEGISQQLFVFSGIGEYLYTIQLDFFKDVRIRQFGASKNEFVFMTIENDFFLAK